MFRLGFAIYVIVEVLAIAAVGAAIGAGWTIMLIIAGSALGMALFTVQARKVIDGIGQVSRGERAAGGVVADSTLGAAGVGLLLVPGLVTSVLGILSLLPPTRWILRPLILAIARRRSLMVSPLVGERGSAGAFESGLHDFVRRQGASDHGGHLVVDGEVVEGEVMDSDTDDINPLWPGLPRHPGQPNTPQR